MPELEVTYYAGTWTERERADIRHAIESAGLAVSEERGTLATYTAGRSEAVQKGVHFVVPPQLIIDAVEVAKDAAPFATLIAAVLAILGALRHRRSEGASVQILTERRIYILLVGDAAANEATKAVPADLRNTDSERRGDMTWRDGRWQTVEELHGLSPRRPRRRARRSTGRPPRA